MTKRPGLLVSIVAAVLVTLAGVLVTGWLFLRGGFSARDQPSAVEAMLARRMRALSVPGSARDAKNPIAVTPEVLTEARAHYADHCATCHANDGSGTTEIGQNLYPKAPDMRLPDTQALTDGEIYYIIHNGIRLTGMPAWGSEEEDQDSWKLAHFIRHLPTLTDAELREMEKLNPKSPADLAEEKEAEEFLSGGTEQPTTPER